MDTRVWIDDPNPIFRMGLACCLRRPGFVLIGESTDFIPRPDLDRTDILVFDLGEQSLGWALGRAGGRGVPEGSERRPARLLGLVGGGGPERDLTRGLCTVLVRSELTPTSFVDCLRSLADLCPPAPEPRLLAAPGLSDEELEVLRLLAQGEGPRGIARGLGFSRRAARGLVAGLVERLGARSPAQAVARALREGVI
ncbi:MAG TPA: LuxR C-terminal-related transcriptional regulator [Acidimicrobiia bacterium]|jgi:DNA-binding CsgD family transcriptional regulator